MIKIVNISPNKNQGFYINRVQYNLTPNEGMYFQDNDISEIESVCDIISNLIMYNFAGPIEHKDALDIVGKGQGVNKTTTGVHGITVTEDFGIGDELFIHWTFHPLIIRDIIPVIHFGFAPVTAEVGKLVSAEISMLGGNGGHLINLPPTSVELLTDLPIPEIAFTSAEAAVEIPVTEIQEGFTDVAFKLKRIAASSDDLVGDVALHHVYVTYKRYLV